MLYHIPKVSIPQNGIGNLLGLCITQRLHVACIVPIELQDHYGIRAQIAYIAYEVWPLGPYSMMALYLDPLG